jgi:ferredoxin
MSEEVTAQGRDAAAGSPSLPPCCNSGCTVCVLDYPELFISDDAGMPALLEAVEQAERTLAERAGAADANHHQGE